MPIWEDALLLMQGSSFWTGLGLGCWHFISPLGWHCHTHSIYLQLYTDTGVFGVIALIVAVVIGAKLAVDIIYSCRKHPYYGFGIGVLLAILVAALVGTIEIASYAIPNWSWEPPWYVLSPIPWLLAAALVTARQLLGQPSIKAITNQGEQ
jgi:O-antigen ligase